MYVSACVRNEMYMVCVFVGDRERERESYSQMVRSGKCYLQIEAKSKTVRKLEKSVKKFRKITYFLFYKMWL